ncbi:MAG: hypothetical protein ACXABK_03740, partial [Candidatus Heimdallarchaeaceae archaeon]
MTETMSRRKKTIFYISLITSIIIIGLILFFTGVIHWCPSAPRAVIKEIDIETVGEGNYTITIQIKAKGW